MLRVHGTILEWFKQKQEICESKRFLPPANCKDQTTRLFGAERILERYVRDPNTIKVMDETRLLFKVLSISKIDVWYNVSMQCFSCDWPDCATKCKHLVGIRSTIEQHIPMFRECVLLIDHAENMHN